MSLSSPPHLFRLLPSQRHRLAWIVVRWAVVVLLAVGGGVMWHATTRDRPATSTSAPLQQIATAVGQRASVTLSDGSNVTVGVASRIRFAPAFGRTRDVYLDGEAFFEVARDPSRPFIVRAARGTARALGTKFNVDAYNTSPELAVLVTEGAVALKAARAPLDSLILRIADLGRVQSGGSLARASDAPIAAYLAWMQGDLVFDRTPIPEVTRRLARWYGIDVQIGDSSLANRSVTAAIGRQSALEALRAVAVTLGARVEPRGAAYVLFVGSRAR